MRYFRNRKRQLRESVNSPLRVCANDSDMCVELETVSEKVNFWNSMICVLGDAYDDLWIYTGAEWNEQFGWDESIDEDDYEMFKDSAYVVMDTYYGEWRGISAQEAGIQAEVSIDANKEYITSKMLERFAR